MKVYESKNWLYERYIIQRKNIIEIAKEAGCSHMTIQRYLEKFGLIKKR
jgi:DNA-binding transcriptional MerR regulator